MNSEELLDIMTNGDLRVDGRLAWGSNYTLFGHACQGEDELTIVYKPRRGERPLWDFPSGTLCSRERAAWLISDAANWNIVPLTILREGPYGWGSVQIFVEHDPEIHYFNFEGEEKFADQLQSIVLFDWITNNADRKGGHVLMDNDERLWAIDHGICFHVEYKLRSVIWEFAGEEISAEKQTTLVQLQQEIAAGPVHDELQNLLDSEEIEIMQRRLQLLLDAGVYPEPGPGRHYPWPPV